jgi:hippurate hydrolase
MTATYQAIAQEQRGWCSPMNASHTCRGRRMQVLARAAGTAADAFAALRRDIHQHPELGYEEHRTSDLVAARLAAWGYEVTRGLGGTGVVGRTARGDGPRGWACAPTWTPCPSTRHRPAPRQPPRRRDARLRPRRPHRHAAGRGAPHREQGRFSGTLNLIFQPAEEGLGGAGA